MTQILFQLKLIFRQLLKNRTYSIINILGLATGMACVMLIFLWISDELSFNSFHKNADVIYQVQQNTLTQEGLYDRGASTPYAIADAFREKIPEIEKASQYARAGRLKLKYKDQVHFEWKSRCVSHEFLTMFSFDMLKGNPETALKDPHTIVLTEKTAKKYFGDEDPLNKIIEINDEYAFRVTGVIKDIPKNSTLDFVFLIPIEFSKTLNRWYDTWDSNSLHTYVQLAKGASVSSVNDKMTQLLREQLAIEWTSDPTNAISRAGYALAPLRDLHLYSFGDYSTGLDNIQYVYIFSLIAFFILIVASINFMNLSIARSLKSSKNIGIKKVSGASRKNIIIQFLNESMSFVLMAVLLGLFFIYLLIPAFNNLTNKEISLSFLKSFKFYSLLFILIILTTLVSGGYPAFFLSSLKPEKVLKGNKLTGNTGIVFRKGLVVFQFFISIWLIIGTIMVVKQTKYMQNKNLGMEKSRILCLQTSGTVSKYYPTLKEELLKYPGINNVSASNDLPIDISSNTVGFNWEGKNLSQDYSINYVGVDYDYFETMDIKFLEGRPYTKEFDTDWRSKFIINERAMHTMGFESAVDLPCNFWGENGKIIGVAKDFHFESLEYPIEPLILILKPDWRTVTLININPADVNQTIKYIEKTWDNVTKGNPINLRFLDEEYQLFYESDVRTSNLLKIFTVLSIFIACLGLFGLSSFMIANRTKEIGVRKVNGARIVEIVKLLNSDFTVWIFLSFIIASPIAYFTMQSWLKNFAYKTELSWWIFALAGIMALLITFLTVSWQCWRAASRNPVEALRYE